MMLPYSDQSLQVYIIEQDMENVNEITQWLCELELGDLRKSMSHRTIGLCGIDRDRIRGLL